MKNLKSITRKEVETNSISYKTTTNLKVFNILHKRFNAHCSYCKWNRFENASKSSKFYDKDRQPNWKLVGRNKFQYQSKDALLVDIYSNRGKFLDYKRIE